jgi:hypothetical protein
LNHASTVLVNWGKKAPSNPREVVFLEVGGWCPGNTTSIEEYGGSGSCYGEWDIAFELSYYLYGYNATHHNRTSVTVLATTNNSVAGSDDSHSVAQGKNWEGSIYGQMANYAASLNSYNASHGYPLRLHVGGGNDLETQWGGPTPAVNWVAGFNDLDTAAMPMFDNGAYYGTCSSSSCWSSAMDHGWSASQKYYTTWGATYDFGFPEIYNTGWPTYYKDLGDAAHSHGFGVPSWTGTLWGCGVVGASEPDAAHAWADFANTTHQRPPRATYLHNLARTC